jgi:hypothetical protein
MCSLKIFNECTNGAVDITTVTVIILIVATAIVPMMIVITRLVSVPVMGKGLVVQFILNRFFVSFYQYFYVKLKTKAMFGSCSAVVEHYTHNPKIVGSNPYPGEEKYKIKSD